MKLQPWQPQESVLQDTILVLKQRQGASLAQIRKRLEVKNSDGKIDEVKNKMLTSTLKGLVLKGTVEKAGGIYKLAKGIPVDAENEIPNRRRKRRRAFGRSVSRRHRRRRRSHQHKRKRHHSRRRRKHHSQRSRRHHSRRRHHRRRKHHVRRRW